MEIRSRHHLRSDDAQVLEDHLAEALGVTMDAETYELVETDGPIDVVLADGDPLAFYPVDAEEPFLTVLGANTYEPTKGIVTVDAGAISFVSDGADVMRPGIVEADPDIEPGDFVVIAEETHRKVLAVGRARVAGSEMLGDSGKVVDSIHHVGDELYQFSP